MCKQQRVEGETHQGQTTKVGFNGMRRVIPREIVDVDDQYSGDILVRLVEALLLLTFTSLPNTDVVATHCI